MQKVSLSSGIVFLSRMVLQKGDLSIDLKSEFKMENVMYYETDNFFLDSEVMEETIRRKNQK